MLHSLFSLHCFTSFDKIGLLLQVCINQLHGTGTPLGDPIEISAAMAVLAAKPGAEPTTPSLTLTAAKSWLGHSEPAAGAVGMAHLCLAFAQSAALPIMHLRSINPHLQDLLVPSLALPRRAYIPRQSAGLQHSTQNSSASSGLVAGVSAFAFQGTNAHVIMQAASAPSDVAKAAVKSTSLLLHQQRHWVAAPAHAMLVHAAVHSGQITYHADVASPSCAYLLDHVVSEQPLLPATAFFELACASVHLSSTDSSASAALWGITLAMPMHLGSALGPSTDPSSGVVTVQLRQGSLIITSHSNKQTKHHMFASWGLIQPQHSSASTTSPKPTHVNPLVKLLTALTKPTSAASQASAIAAVAQPHTTDGLALHPAAADSTLHLASAFSNTQEAAQLRVPAALDAIQVSSHKRVQSCTWGCATPADMSLPASHIHSFRLSSAQGSSQATLQGLQLKALQANPLSSAAAEEEGSSAAASNADCLYEVAWLADVDSSTNSSSSMEALLLGGAHKTIMGATAALMRNMQSAAAGGPQTGTQVGPIPVLGHVTPSASRSSPTAIASTAVASLMRSVAQELASTQYTSITIHPQSCDDKHNSQQLDTSNSVSATAGDQALQGRVQHSPRLMPSAASVTAKPFQLVPKPRGALQNLTAEAIGTELAPDEVLLRVHAVGVNFRDVLNVLGMYPGDPGAPGADCAGVVIAVGSAVRGLRTGDLLHWLA